MSTTRTLSRITSKEVGYGKLINRGKKLQISDIGKAPILNTSTPKTIISYDQVDEQMLSKGIEQKVSILGENLENADITDITKMYESFSKNEIGTTTSVLKFKASGNRSKVPIPITKLSFVSRMLHQASGVDVKHTHPFARFHEIRLMWIPLFGGTQSTETRIQLVDTRKTPEIVIGESVFQNGQMVFAMINMNFFVSREDEEYIMLNILTDEKPISSGEYGAMYAQIAVEKTNKAILIKPSETYTVYIDSALPPKNLSDNQMLKFGKDEALKRIEKARSMHMRKGQHQRHKEDDKSIFVEYEDIGISTDDEEENNNDQMVNMTTSSLVSSSSSYYLDSGANCHIIASESESDEKTRVVLGGKHIIEGFIFRNYIVSTSPKITLPIVVATSGVSHNLLSESKLKDDNILSHLRDGKTMKLGLKMKEIIFTARIDDNGLYKITFNSELK